MKKRATLTARKKTKTRTTAEIRRSLRKRLGPGIPGVPLTPVAKKRAKQRRKEGDMFLDKVDRHETESKKTSHPAG